MDWIVKTMDNIAKHGLFFIFAGVFVAGIFVKAVYCFDDSPAFTGISSLDVMWGCFVGGGLFLIIRYADQIQRRLSIAWTAVIYFAAQFLYLWMVPLEPFSDMEGVYLAACDFSTFQWDKIRDSAYLSQFHGNLELTIFYGILLLLFPGGIWMLKFINVVLSFLLSYLIMKICQEYGLKYDRVIFLCSICFIPVFLYSNHVYYDLLFVTGCLLGGYIYVRKNMPAVMLILGIMGLMRVNAYIFAIAILLDAGFAAWRTRRSVRKIVRQTVIGIILLCVIGVGARIGIQKVFVRSDGYSFWNQIYIGFNEKEFGFMDNDFSYDRSFADVADRLEEYGFVRTGKILVKKIFWEWTQGTYQVQRYAFGNDTKNAQEKFSYETSLNVQLLRDDQTLRSNLNSLMRMEYMGLFFLMLVAMYENRNQDITSYRWIYYAIAGTFLILLVWEMKSRYTMQCYPLICILACRGVEYLKENKLRLRYL